MFRVLVLIVVLISTLAAAPVSDEAQAKIIKYENTNDGTGNYHFSFETSNGISREETGKLVAAGEPQEHISVRGVYTYINPDGKKETVYYLADENGYQVLSGPDEVPLLPPDFVIEPVSVALPPSAVASLLG